MAYCKCEWLLSRKISFEVMGDLFSIGGYRVLYRSFLSNDFRLRVSDNKMACELFKNGYTDLKNVHTLYERMLLMDAYVACPKCAGIIFSPKEIKELSLLSQFSNAAYYDLLTYLENMVISREINYRYV